MKKLYDCAVKVGTYQKNGEEKANWLRCGALFEGDKGQFILLDKTFNPAGVPDQSGKGSILISLFEPKDKPVTNQANEYANASGASARDDEYDL